MNTPRLMTNKGKKGSNGQKGNHNSRALDQLAVNRKVDKSGCQSEPVPANTNPIKAMKSPILQLRTSLVALCHLDFPQAAMRNAKAMKPNQKKMLSSSSPVL